MTTHDETAPEQIDGAERLDDVAATIGRYVILPNTSALIAVVLWIGASHAVPAWNCAPRLVIRAPEKRCGKSRLLDMVEGLCHRPLMTTNASPSAVYRSISMKPSDPPTLLIDEADTIFGDKANGDENLRGLLNAGHQRGRTTIRYNAGRDTVEKHPTFAMAALAGIGAMPDTIEDRAAVIRMRRRAPGESVQPYRVRRDGPELDVLRQSLNRWLTAHLDELTDAAPDMPLEDRAADTWEPMIAVADLAGGQWPRAARKAAVSLTSDRDAGDEASLHTRLLADCRIAFQDADALPTAELLDRLKGDPGSAVGDARTKRAERHEARQPAARFRDPIQQHSVHHRAGEGLHPQRLHRRLEPLLPRTQGDCGWGRRPSRPRRPRAGQHGDGFRVWDGSSRPTEPSRPGPDLGCNGWDGWDGLGSQGCSRPLRQRPRHP
jgi:hypothetical protein